MKNSLTSTITLLIASASPAFAANGSSSAGIGIITILFLGFFGLIVATQVLPGLFLFFTGTKSLFGKRNNEIASKR
ncbi:MAG: hypothetical protein A2X84_06065 [Desulfuromonadaceae bacterium GWC2_58_13]|nr:MAG: hypothetical protein A2X84_06065 [Desulfuromonadaceae bacterium GWC2_58_13]